MCIRDRANTCLDARTWALSISLVGTIYEVLRHNLCTYRVPTTIVRPVLCQQMTYYHILMLVKMFYAEFSSISRFFFSRGSNRKTVFVSAVKFAIFPICICHRVPGVSFYSWFIIIATLVKQAEHIWARREHKFGVEKTDFQSSGNQSFQLHFKAIKDNLLSHSSR